MLMIAMMATRIYVSVFEIFSRSYIKQEYEVEFKHLYALLKDLRTQIRESIDELDKIEQKKCTSRNDEKQ